jgi:hypothetical protein
LLRRARRDDRVYSRRRLDWLLAAITESLVVRGLRRLKVGKQNIMGMG